MVLDESEVTAALRAAGARFAFVHGSRATGERVRPDSDLDVGVWWGDAAGAVDGRGAERRRPLRRFTEQVLAWMARTG